MNRYPRKPAAVILLVSTVLGFAYVVAWGRYEASRKQKLGGHTVEAMEQKVAEEQKAGTVSAPTWRAYGEVLYDARKFDAAAAAYKQALDLEPGHYDSKFQRGLALAQGTAPDLFYQFQKDLVYSDAKLAVKLFEQAEAQRHLTEERFSALAREAQNQAMD